MQYPKALCVNRKDPIPGPFSYPIFNKKGKVIKMETLKTLYKTGKEKFKGKYEAALICAMTVICSVNMTYAEDIFDKSKGIINSLYTDLLALAAPLYGLVALICLIYVFIPGRDSEKGLTWLKRATIAFFAACCIGWIIKLVQSLTTGGSTL